MSNPSEERIAQIRENLGHALKRALHFKYDGMTVRTSELREFLAAYVHLLDRLTALEETLRQIQEIAGQ